MRTAPQNMKCFFSGFDHTLYMGKCLLYVKGYTWNSTTEDTLTRQYPLKPRENSNSNSYFALVQSLKNFRFWKKLDSKRKAWIELTCWNCRQHWRTCPRLVGESTREETRSLNCFMFRKFHLCSMLTENFVVRFCETKIISFCQQKWKK